MLKNNAEDTIVAISTPVGEGGIGIVRMSGPRSLKIADGIFLSKDGSKPSKFRTYTTHYGHIVAENRIIDEVILTVMKTPKSYTKEDVVEINCHGGIQAVKKVLDLALKRGARLAEPGEFTRRAFLNGRLDLAQAEAVADVIRAKTEASLKVAMNQLEGELSRSVDAVRQDAIDIASHIEAGIDFPEEGLELGEKKALVKKTEDVVSRLKKLVDSYEEGIVFREGVLAIICGKPNVGKSSLMNLLLKRDRVIVSPLPGTTRDAVEEIINLRGIPIRIVDTAGISETKGAVEKEAVLKSKRYLEMADIVLLMLDASAKIDKRDLDIIKLVKGKKKIVLINKIDLARNRKTGKDEVKALFEKEKVMEVSVEKKRNIKELEDMIADTVFEGRFSQAESAIVSNARHREALDKAYRCMLSVKRELDEELSPELTAIDLREAIFELGLVMGKSVSEDILDRIFERFCIGK
ncbi:MAG: tRNA uridine-5-carboxymethylaminomethyl(34) synthesis GTPase MnmE [Candidatus Omnitrophica bacterium]|nr:tRNA uridine-5-carboxymethylaminomethyl(34) synthesis GTPase MnmE [Candidatus Omnitrophota bacterium]